MILERQLLAMRGMLGLVRRPLQGVQRANEPYAAMAQVGRAVQGSRRSGSWSG